jgi:hypothetical protein
MSSDLKRLMMLTSVRHARLAAAERRLAEAINRAQRAWVRFDAAERAAIDAERHGLARIAAERHHLFTVKFTVAGVSELRATVAMVDAEIATHRRDAEVAEQEALDLEAARSQLARDVQVQRAKVDRLDDEVVNRKRQRAEHRDAAEVAEFAERVAS